MSGLVCFPQRQEEWMSELVCFPLPLKKTEKLGRDRDLEKTDSTVGFISPTVFVCIPRLCTASYGDNPPNMLWGVLL
jgi:hypothetical protein